MATETEKQAAVQKLDAAAGDLNLLAAALNAARFLEEIPGDHRQKFRGTPSHTLLRNPAASAAKTRYRKLKEAADAAAAAEKDLVDEDVTQFPTLSQSYESLNWRLESKPGGATIKPKAYYQLYGLAKQATHGTRISRPRISKARSCRGQRYRASNVGRERRDRFRRA